MPGAWWAAGVGAVSDWSRWAKATHRLILGPQTGALLADERVEVEGDDRPTQRSAMVWLETGGVGFIDERL